MFKILAFFLAVNSSVTAASVAVIENNFLRNFPGGMLKKIADSNYLLNKKDLGTQGVVLLRLTAQNEKVVTAQITYTPVKNPKKSTLVTMKLVKLLFKAFTGNLIEEHIDKPVWKEFWEEVEAAALNPCKGVFPLQAKDIKITFYACEWDNAGKDGGYICNLVMKKEL